MQKTEAALCSYMLPAVYRSTQYHIQQEMELQTFSRYLESIWSPPKIHFYPLETSFMALDPYLNTQNAGTT